MAQPVQFLVNFLGSMIVKAGTKYTTADIITEFPTATLMIMKTRSTASCPNKVSVNSYPAFEIEFNEHAYIETGSAYTFTKDCEIAICKYVSGS